jgi:hypothetical protein
VSTRTTFPNAGGTMALSLSIPVHPDTGRLLSPIPTDLARSGALKNLTVDSIPVPIRCAHHGRWHPLPDTTVTTWISPLPPGPDDPMAALGTTLTLASAPACRSAAKRASAFRAAWRRLSTQLPRLDEPADDTDALLNSCLDRLTLVPRALSHAGVDLREALNGLASAPVPSASHPVWPPKNRSHAILPHKCPASQDWHAAGSARLPLIYPVDYPKFFQNVYDMCAVLAAQMSATCEEAVQRLRLASRHLDRPTSERSPRAHVLVCQQAARALRAVLLPPADFALEALKDA